MKKENAYLTHWRQFRAIVIAQEEPVIAVCNDVINRHFDGTGEGAGTPKYEIVKRFTLATALREFTELSLHEIGAKVGLGHSVVVYGRKKIRKTYLNHAVYGSRIQACMTEIEERIDREVHASYSKPYAYELT